MDLLQARVQGLEKERWLYRTLVLLGALAGLSGAALAVLGAGSQAPSGAVRGLSVVDRSGKPRMEFKVDAQSQQPLLIMYDERGNARQVIGLSQAGDPEVLLLSADRKHRASMSVNVEGSPQLVLFDSGGLQRLVMNLSIGTHDPRIELLGPDQKPQLAISSSTSGVSIVDGAGQRAVFSASTSP